MKYTICRLAALFLLCAAALPSYGQFGLGKIKEIIDAQNRKLIVVTETENENVTKRLSKRDNAAELLKLYKKAIEEYNENMKLGIEMHWKWNKKIEYKTLAEVLALKKAKNKDYAVLFCNSYSQLFNNLRFNGLNWAPYNLTEDDSKNYWRSYTCLELRLIEEWSDMMPIAYTAVAYPFPQAADVVYAIKSMDTYLYKRLEKQSMTDMRDLFRENAKVLPERTLLIRKEFIDRKKIPNDADIKKYYPYKYEVVDSAKFNEMVILGTPGYIYLMITPHPTYGGNSGNVVAFAHWLVDNETGGICGYDMSAVAAATGTAMMLGGIGGKIAGNAVGASARLVDDKNFKNYIEFYEKAIGKKK